MSSSSRSFVYLCLLLALPLAGCNESRVYSTGPESPAEPWAPPSFLDPAGYDAPDGPTIANNLSRRFVIPYVLALKAAAPGDLSPAGMRSGWSTSIGIYNPSSSTQEYRLSFYDGQGNLAVRYRTRGIPPRQNVFTTPEIVACINRPATTPLEPCAPEATFILETGDPDVLAERRFAGYLEIEDLDGVDAFHASAWIARGGVDLVNPVSLAGGSCTVAGNCQFVSFGYNRAAGQVPAVPEEAFTGRVTRAITFPGLSLRTLGTAQTPDHENPNDPGVIGEPNGQNAGLALLNLGDETAIVTVSFLRDGEATPAATGTSFPLAPGEQRLTLLTDHLPGDLGRGVARATVSGNASVVGYAFQSDARFEFHGFGVTGQNRYDDPGELPSVVDNVSDRFFIPYAIHAGGRAGFESALSIYNPNEASLSVTLSLFDEAGSSAVTRTLAILPGGALHRRLSDLAIPSGFVGWATAEAADPFVLNVTNARGGTDTEAFGWQTMAFDVPVIPARTSAATRSIVLPAVNESLTYANLAPPLAPTADEDIEHVNGFDLGVRAVNVGAADAHFRLVFERRYVTPADTDDAVVSSAVHPLPVGHSAGIVVGNDFADLDPDDLRDGLLRLELVHADGTPGATGRLLVTAVESDRGFKWFGYGVTGQRTP